MKHLLWLLLIWLLPETTLGSERIIRIVFTSDVHGALFPDDLLNNRNNAPSLASLQTWLDSTKAAGPQNLILLDNGDLIQGTPAAYYANFIQKKRSNLFSSVLNHLKFDAATVGNHDIEAGPGVYYRLQQEYNFPFLGGNVINTTSGETAFTPYTIIERQGVRIAILGLITPGIPNWLPAVLWPDLEFQPLLESARYWTSHIQRHESTDAIIALLHTGMGNQNRPQPGTLIENAGWLIAKEVEGLDLVLLGHDHRPRSEIITNAWDKEIPVLNPGSNMQRIGYAELCFQQGEDKNWVLSHTAPQLIDLRDTQPSRAYLKKFRADRRAVNRYAERKIAQLTGEMSAGEVLFGSAAFTDLIHEFQLSYTGADLSFTAPLSTSGILQSGWITTVDMFRLYRYENFLYTMQLTGREIKDYLEYSYSLWFNTMKSEDDHILNFRKDSVGRETVNDGGRMALAHPSFNFDSAAGILYTVDVSKPPGSRIEIEAFENGAPFLETSRYTVAINSYRGSGGGGHLTTGAGIADDLLHERIIFTSNSDIRSLLMNFLNTRRTFTPAARENWRPVPEDWVEKGTLKDLSAGF